jgi:hypothetical protein
VTAILAVVALALAGAMKADCPAYAHSAEIRQILALDWSTTAPEDVRRLWRGELEGSPCSGSAAKCLTLTAYPRRRHLSEPSCHVAFEFRRPGWLSQVSASTEESVLLKRPQPSQP